MMSKEPSGDVEVSTMADRETPDRLAQAASALLDAVREKQPLVHHMTNLVVTNVTANLTLALGAAPVMANAPEEVEEMASAAAALVLNIGTLTRESVAAMLLAGKAATARGIPVVLDPVGVGATRMRRDAALLLMREVKPAVLRGNDSEIVSLAQWVGAWPWTVRGQAGQSAPGQNAPGQSAPRQNAAEPDAAEQGARRPPDTLLRQRGVDSARPLTDEADRAAVVASLARRCGAVVAMTGARDWISDGRHTLACDNGHPLLTRVTGTGCMATAAIGAFAAVASTLRLPYAPLTAPLAPLLTATAAALAWYGLAAERAAGDARGPGSFQTALFDEVYALCSQDALSLRLVAIDGAVAQPGGDDA